MSHYISKRVASDPPGRSAAYNIWYASPGDVHSHAATVIVQSNGTMDTYNEFGNIIPNQEEYTAVIDEWHKWNPGIWP